jgi:hypothetical protein
VASEGWTRGAKRAFWWHLADETLGIDAASVVRRQSTIHRPADVEGRRRLLNHRRHSPLALHLEDPLLAFFEDFSTAQGVGLDAQAVGNVLWCISSGQQTAGPLALGLGKRAASPAARPLFECYRERLRMLNRAQSPLTHE